MDGVILSSAFELRKKNKQLGRPKDEKELSVDWYEYYDRDNYKNIVSALINRNLAVKPAGMLAKLNVGNVRKEILRQLKLKISIDNLGPASHSSIRGLSGYDPAAALIFVNLIDEKIVISDISNYPR
jgi:MoaA/NifB/PqqE/SkfB family radical SAM enzyme